MPRVKKHNDTGREVQISAAIKSLKEGKQESIRAAAEAFDILRLTLNYRYTGERTSHQLAQVNNQLIIQVEEKAIVAWCKEQDDRGFPPRLDMVKDMTLYLYEKRTGNKIIKVGKKWITRFLDRHPDLATKFSTKLDCQWAHASCLRLLKDYFSNSPRFYVSTTWSHFRSLAWTKKDFWWELHQERRSFVAEGVKTLVLLMKEHEKWLQWLKQFAPPVSLFRPWLLIRVAHSTRAGTQI